MICNCSGCLLLAKTAVSHVTANKRVDKDTLSIMCAPHPPRVYPDHPNLEHQGVACSGHITPVPAGQQQYFGRSVKWHRRPTVQ